MASKPAEQRLRSRKPIPKPVPAYLPSSAGSPLSVSPDLYDAIQKAPRTLLQGFTLPIRSGRAWKAPAGSIIRISTPEGPQVGASTSPSLIKIQQTEPHCPETHSLTHPPSGKASCGSQKKKHAWVFTLHS